MSHLGMFLKQGVFWNSVLWKHIYIVALESRVRDMEEVIFLTLNEPATRGRIVDRVEVKLDLTSDQ